MSPTSSFNVFMSRRGGVTRLYVFLLCLALAIRYKSFLGTSLYREPLYATPLFQWLHLPALHSSPLMVAFFICLTVGLIYSLRGSLALLALFGILLFWVTGSANSGFLTEANSFGTHDRLLPLWTLGFLFLYLSWKREKSDIAPETFLLAAPVASSLLAAGLYKILNSGLHWFHSESLVGILLFRGMLTDNDLALSLSQSHPWILSGLSAAAITLQLVAPLALLFKPRLALCLFLSFVIFNHLFLSLSGFLEYWTPQLLAALLGYWTVRSSSAGAQANAGVGNIRGLAK